MKRVLGTKGYEKVVESFAGASLKLDFDYINEDFLDFLPPAPARVLDAGAGVGQNAAALARRGYEVVAVEPLTEFIQIAKQTFANLNISWLQDSLPNLEMLSAESMKFDFILIDGVWHHLNPQERELCIERCFEILKPQAKCAISLRNGPAGSGKHIFPTSVDELVQFAEKIGFDVIFLREDQPSKMKNKPDVVWSRAVIQKTTERNVSAF